MKLSQKLKMAITSSFLKNAIKTGIIKTDISDNFPIFMCHLNLMLTPQTNFIFKRYINI